MYPLRERRRVERELRVESGERAIAESAIVERGREREREGGSDREKRTNTHTHTHTHQAPRRCGLRARIRQLLRSCIRYLLLQQ